MLPRVGVIVLMAGGLLLAQSGAERRLQEATWVLQETMEMSDQGIPQDLLNKAHCAVIIPEMKKGAFIFGGKYGRGFITCRKEDGAGWSAPAGIRVEGGSVGLQIGGSETDVLMLVMNERGKDKLLQSRFTIGGDASAAAGPVGRTAAAQTDAQMRAELLTYSRARGVFAGISLDGATLRPDKDANKRLYGEAMTNREIVASGVEPPAAAKELLSLLTKYSTFESR